MKYLVREQLVELKPTAQAVADKPLRIYRLDFLHEAASHMDGNLVEITLESHDSGNAAAIESAGDSLHRDSRHQVEQIRIRLPDHLLPQVTGGIVGHACRHRAKFGIELPGTIQVAQVFSQVIGVS